MGRVKGTPNKFTSSFKQALQLAYDKIGGIETFATWARENQTEFYKIMARLIPVEVNASVNHVVQAAELSDDELAGIARGGSRTPAGATESSKLTH